VIAAQEESNKQRQKIENDMRAKLADIKASEQALLAEVVDPPMPPEFAAALAAAQAERDDIRSQAASRYEQERKRASDAEYALHADLLDKTKAIYVQVEQRKADIMDEFDDKSSGVLDNIAKLTTEIKAATIIEGKTVKGKYWQAVYVKGRVTWITDMLDGMCVAFPALLKARKEGEPSITLRRN
jgi:hypothetical protein